MSGIILNKSTLAEPLVQVTEALRGYEIKNVRFAADGILPLANSDVKSGVLPTFRAGETLMIPSVERSPGDPYPRSAFNVDGKTFICHEYGHEVPVPEETEKELRLNLAVSIAAKAAFQLKLKREQRVANALFNTSLFTGAALYTDVSTAWSAANAATMTPVADIEAAKELVLSATGAVANTVLLNHVNLRYLKGCEDLVTQELIQVNPAAGKPADSPEFLAYLAEKFGVKQVIVPTCVYNSTNNSATPTLLPIWSSSYCLVAYVPEAMGADDLAAEGLGRTVAWTQDGGVEVVESYYDESRRSNIIRVRQSIAEFLNSEKYAHLLKVD